MIELRDMVVVQQEKMRNMEEEVKEQKTLVTVMASKLSASDSLVKDLQARLSTSESHVADLQARLSTSEVHVEDLMEESEVHLAQLATIETRLTAAESQVHQLRNTPKVAFSAGLTDDGYVGPYDSITPLVFKKVFSNVGNAYNPSTGVFSAPVKGLYHITYGAFSLVPPDEHKKTFHVYLYKNNEQLLFTGFGWNSGGYEQITNGVMVELEEGDTVGMSLEAWCKIYDDMYNFSVFNGVLVYAM